MRKWLMGLKCGGLMEMPEWSVENVHEVEADNLTEAKDKWWEAVEEMGELKWGWWNPQTRTYFGWEVVECVPAYRQKP